MKNLEFVRIDDRLIHGQVCAAWLKTYSDVTNIIVCDDAVSKDPFMHEMFQLLVPNDITIDIKSVEDTIETLRNGLKEKTMMIVKVPLTLKKIIDAGIDIPKINIGGMGMSPGRKKLFQNISASNEERVTFKEMIDKGATLEIQIIPAAKTINLATILK